MSREYASATTEATRHAPNVSLEETPNPLRKKFRTALLILLISYGLTQISQYEEETEHLKRWGDFANVLAAQQVDTCDQLRPLEQILKAGFCFAAARQDTREGVPRNNLEN